MALIPGRLDLKLGEEARVELPGLGTSGYLWDGEVDGPADVVVITWRPGEVASPKLRSVGNATPEVAVLRANKRGRVTVRLVQRRPWERNIPPVRSHLIDVTVTDS